MSNQPTSPSSVDGSETAAHATGAVIGVIDHEGYPHIIDKILDHADAEFLLTFRLMSKLYAQRCLKILMQHLVVRGQPFGYRGPLNIRSTRGLVPRLDKGIYSHEGLRIRVESSLSDLAFCKTLDVVGPTGPKCPRTLTQALPHLRTLRLMSDGDDYLSNHNFDCPAKTVVVFGSLPLVHEYDNSRCRWKGPGWPTTSHKLVWNVTGVASSLESGKPLIHYRFHTGLQEVVLHFSNRLEDEGGCRSLDRFCETIHYFLKYCNIPVVTLVDLDLVPLSKLNFFPNLLDHPDERQLHLTQRLGDLADRLRFKTGDEYRAEVGAEQYRIETCKRLW